MEHRTTLNMSLSSIESHENVDHCAMNVKVEQKLLGRHFYQVSNAAAWFSLFSMLISSSCCVRVGSQ